MHCITFKEMLGSPKSVFREGRFVENLKFEFEDVGRYVRIILRGPGRCPQVHVRPGMEAQMRLDEVLIE